MERWVKLKKVGAVNTGKNMAALMGLFGLIYGIGIFFFVATGAAGAARYGSGGGLVAAGLGIGAALLAVLLPLLFAAFGFVYGAALAAVWNFVLARLDGFHMLVDFPEETKKK